MFVLELLLLLMYSSLSLMAVMVAALLFQVGTLLYIAPEIVKGDCYDERCDVYSFGVVLLAIAHLRDDVITLFAEEVNTSVDKQGYSVQRGGGTAVGRSLPCVQQGNYLFARA